MKKFAVGLLILIGFASTVSAIEALPRGQLQLQATYFDPAIGDDARWALAMPNNFVGVTAVENLTSSTLMGHWQVGIDPLSTDADVVLKPQLAFLSWRQGIVNLWGGRLPSLERVYLEESYSGHLSLQNKGLVASQFYDPSELKAVRLDATSGDYLVFTGQWIIDENSQDLAWSAATAIQAPEGSLSLTYRKNGDTAALWGSHVSWQSGNVVLSGVWVYQEELLGWDMEARFLSQGVESFVGFSQDDNKQNRWSIGVHQILSSAVTNYSEIVRWSQSKQWQWTTGFQIKF